jgi:hypothetical protein
MGWLRNYGAMNDDKLLRTIKEFQSGYGTAITRVQDKGGDMDENRAKAEYEARRRGLIDDNFMPPEGTEVFTEARFCPECEKKKPFRLDDYICRLCRDAQ